MIISVDRRQPSSRAVRVLSRAIRQSMPVVLPTETRYALTCDATSQRAIEAARAIKGRKPEAPFSVFLSGIAELKRWRIECPEYASRLAACFWPGPLTLVLPTTGGRLKFLGGHDRSVGVRITPEPLITMLLKATGVPLVATSANPTGIQFDASAENRWLTDRADAGALLWVRPRRYVRRPASTVLDCTGRVPRELRPGPITRKQWNAVLGRAV